MEQTTTRPMFAVSYAALAIAPDDSIAFVLENGRVISLAASTAATLNEARRREGRPAIPTVSHPEALALARRLAARDAADGARDSVDDSPE